MAGFQPSVDLAVLPSPSVRTWMSDKRLRMPDDLNTHGFNALARTLPEWSDPPLVSRTSQVNGHPQTQGTLIERYTWEVNGFIPNLKSMFFFFFFLT